MLRIIKKVFKVIAKAIAGIFAFYLLVAFIVIPVGVPWLIRSQGTKILKHTVKARSAWFNPFLLTFSIKGFEILDAQHEPMVGFDRFFVNVSFISLLKKEYRVEALNLDGLKVNSALLEGNAINLLELVPAQPVIGEKIETAQAPADVTSEDTPPAEPLAPQPLPAVTVDSIILERGTINFTDRTIEPVFSTSLHDIDLRITNVSTDPQRQTQVNFQAKLDEKGIMSSQVLLKPLAVPLQLEMTFSLNSYAMQILTPYVGKYTGREVGDGKLDVKMDYRIADNKLVATHTVLVQRFDFGKKVKSKHALNLPFGLALALLEDPQGRISIKLPVHGDMSDPEFEYFHLIGQVVSNFFIKLFTKPFAMLASMLGSETGTDELGYVRFLPGKADLLDEEKEKLSLLIKGLNERPKLLLEVNGSYDPQPDWQAIKTDVFNNDFAALSQESKRSEDWVYQTLYQRRFGIRSLWDLTRIYRMPDRTYDHAGLNEEIRRRLIEDAPPDEASLEALARQRAGKVYDFIAASGFDLTRLSLGDVKTVQGSMGFVPLEFTLTVFDNSLQESLEETAGP